LEGQIAYLKNKVQARQLRHALMWWEGKWVLPDTPIRYHELFNYYKDTYYFKVIYEKDKALEIDKKKRQSQASTTYKASFKDEGDIENLPKERLEQLKEIAVQKAINEDVKKNTSQIFMKAEISVIQREFDILLIKEGIKLINKHDEALKGCLEMGAADNQLNFIHPYQQFASTLYETVDRNPHLDIVTKASFVQQFLTRLRNRCTEVETLTSGPGVVFSMKDFNDCIQTLCRGMIKYWETSIRSINETSLLKSHHLQHLVYIKERQMEYYKRKWETFVNEIDKIINAKMTEKGASIIYELDITHRELRMLKDNYYLMERMMREEIQRQFIDEITEKDYLIKKYREGFKEYKERVNKGISSEVYDEITTIEERVKARANVYKMTDIKGTFDLMKRLTDAERQKGLQLKIKDAEVRFENGGEFEEKKSITSYEVRRQSEEDGNY
jgi:hypothetical protein